MIREIKNKMNEWLSRFKTKNEIKIVVTPIKYYPVPESKKIELPKKCQNNKCNEKLTILSFYCKYCGQYHCAEHRLPENHSCDGVVSNPYYNPLQDVYVPQKIPYFCDQFEDDDDDDIDDEDEE